MEYNFNEVEAKWQKIWKENKTYSVKVEKDKPKFYVLDMFPYPSGAGLHVGHPLGYIASDIYSRYKRQKGYNVLHPMGYDAYGLPAEQYAIQTGQHPATTTERNIARYRQQLDKIGFSYDWDREVRTCEPEYYKWTQWTFIQLYKSWFNKKTNKAENINVLVDYFNENGSVNIDAACAEHEPFSANDWKNMSEAEQQSILMNYRLAYLSETHVNWCPALGTVLANDEVKEGFSVRGNHPVERKKMNQWFLRITAYSERLLDGLDKIEWSDSLKEIQKNWIGKSEGASVLFKVKDFEFNIEIFTSRPDTIFGATFMVLAPEHELTLKITTKEFENQVLSYINEAKKKSERERISEVKKVSGQFTGAYCIHPFTGENIPVYISDYVLAGYGTGAIMAVPAHDSRDYDFAKHFKLPIIEVVSGGNIEVESYDAKEGKLINSDFINGLEVKDAISKVLLKIEEVGIGKKQINYRLRDAIFSRQRYWGEPFPVFYKNGIPYVLDEDKLPLELPAVDAYLPTESGQPPLARAKNWQTSDGYPLECNTMPGFAGSSAYYIRYMDPRNNKALVAKDAVEYWRNVDLYIGGAEHATGHLIYARFWNKFLFDIGLVVEDEPFKKLINQGMIQGRSSFVYRVKGSNKFVSYNLRKDFDTMPIHVDVYIVHNDILDVEAFRNWNAEYKTAEFVLENGNYVCGWEVEKMSKSFHNVVNPDDLIEKYGADTLRLYEMFLGPIEQAKPWDTNGIEGVFRFIRKLWRLFHSRDNNFEVTEEKPTDAEFKILHKTIKKISEDIERFSFNTSVSAFMVCVNELTDLKCNKREILQPLVVTLSSFAPHICEELWHLLGNETSVVNAKFPDVIQKYVEDDVKVYPVSFNGKMRFTIELPANMKPSEVEAEVLKTKDAEKYLQGNKPKKVIVVPGKIVNIVV
ncbi:MAG: leucine--tRNA ligase [Bacteroidetes bacterium]|nr:leucine--tRNA ligase [Bacteroidota bacterium]